MPVPMLLSDYNEVHRIPGLEPPALRELRKRLDSGLLTGQEYDSIAIDLLEHCAMLASDYIGNSEWCCLLNTHFDTQAMYRHHSTSL